jgi:hypothetical protein
MYSPLLLSFIELLTANTLTSHFLPYVAILPHCRNLCVVYESLPSNYIVCMSIATAVVCVNIDIKMLILRDSHVFLR